MPRVMGRVVDGHGTGEPHAPNDGHPEQNGEQSREKDICDGSGFVRSGERVDHREPQSVPTQRPSIVGTRRCRVNSRPPFPCSTGRYCQNRVHDRFAPEILPVSRCFVVLPPGEFPGRANRELIRPNRERIRAEQRFKSAVREFRKRVRQQSTHPPPLTIVRIPSAANTTAAVIRIALTGSFSAIVSPIRTAGIFASIMPSVVPRTTGRNCSNRAASPTVAICVLSPISAMKKAHSVAVNAPERLIARSSPSYLSGNSAHTATLKNESPSTHRIHGPLSTPPKKVPAKPAAA